ncbi:hypothetical protein DSO57_1009294 [Entomophthora muscae]|uniref:Uncharacterized protein n=1 Tax=Entomophthora muscae TaxID=34485 RepID=A0ACC2US50_9FUNG|nr:hypothetical protein DSO57_1009294 [Entomophthora muscae]
MISEISDLVAEVSRELAPDLSSSSLGLPAVPVTVASATGAGLSADDAVRDTDIAVGIYSFMGWFSAGLSSFLLLVLAFTIQGTCELRLQGIPAALAYIFEI